MMCTAHRCGIQMALAEKRVSAGFVSNRKPVLTQTSRPPSFREIVATIPGDGRHESLDSITNVRMV